MCRKKFSNLKFNTFVIYPVQHSTSCKSLYPSLFINTREKLCHELLLKTQLA